MTIERAYSMITVKAVNEDAREITGIATTPETDRMGDIVESDGAEFKLPIPLLWQHDPSQPVGHVTAAKVTAKGIEITAKFISVADVGTLKDRLDEAWQSVKAGLVRGLSIGFQPIESARIEGTWGMRFTKWLWLELSAVTIPANGGATIQTVKSLDRKFLAASGRVNKSVVRIGANPAGDTATKAVNSTPVKGSDHTMKLQEQITAFKAKQQANRDRMNAIMEKAVEDGNRTLDAAEAEEYDALDAEVTEIDSHLKRLMVLEAKAVDTAVTARRSVPVSSTADPDDDTGVTVQRTTSRVETMRAPVLGQGLAMAQVVKLLGRAQGNRYEALNMAKSMPDVVDARTVAVLKAAVAAGTTTNDAWAGALVGEYSSTYADFVEFLRPQTILGKFGTNGIPALRRVPFRVALIAQTSGGAGYWVGEGQAKPLTSFDFARQVLDPLKVANIAVVTEETLRDSSPAADVIVRDSLVDALRERLDIDLVDPAKAAVAGVSPASLTNGVTPVVSSGSTIEDIDADVRAVMARYVAANNPPTSGVWLMSSMTALALGQMKNPLGQYEYPNLSMTGGTFQGLPVIVSDYLAGDSNGAIVVLVNAQDVYFADDGGFTVDMSREASLQMDSAPTHNSTTPTGAQLVSMWQTNSVAFRAERTLNWLKRRLVAVQYISGVNWGAGTGS